ncbi:hypothetical protein [Azospirillum argentinense]|uniref:Uncharacterized protein n=1 Tax=Azospirillum argentinense TaxID=2970906 RepID=A0A5B0KQU0_9PROT|nr:hypothetical protein [Azospirillum argentinense]KAA1053144.1 hypothetical protein FH063_003063 [Azospirillum argentinense]
MKTWLDWYISGYAVSGRTTNKANSSDQFVARISEVYGVRFDKLSDVDAFRLIEPLKASFSAIVDSPSSIEPDSLLGNSKAFSRFLLPFALSLSDPLEYEESDFRFNTVAIQPSRELVALLSQAKAPLGQNAMVDGDLMTASWYVDLPHGSLLVGDLGVRAIFTQPSQEHGAVAICAVLCISTADQILGRLMWVAGDGEANGLVSAEIDKRLVAEQVEDFLSLLVLYRRHADTAQRGQLPRMTREMATSRKARQHHKKASLFAVQTLAPPPDRFGRRQSLGEGGWQLGWRSSVAGHFKMQPHGPGRSLRKLIFVDAYERGPDDGPRKHRLERLSNP